MISEHFSRGEFKCHCGKCACDTVDGELLDLLEAVRRYFKAPVTVTSGMRCVSHNITIGGKPGSQHLLGKAADIVVKGVEPDRVAAFAEGLLEFKGGIGRYQKFTHLDVRDAKARWAGQ